MITTVKKIRICLMLLFLTIAVLTGGGCWDRVEIENVAFVDVMGVDRAGDGNVLVTFYVVNPAALGKQSGGGGGEEPPAYISSIEARDVPQAVSKYAEESPRLVRFKQLQVIIVGEDQARQGVGPVMDFFSRQREMRRSIWLLMAKGKAQDILVKGKMPPEKLLSAGIKTILERQPVHSATRYPIVLGDFVTAMSIPGQEPIVSSVEIYPMREATTGGPYGEDGLAAAEGSAAEENNVLAFKGAGVFRDDKLLDFLGPSETRGVLWVQGKVQGGRIVVPAPSQGDWASLAIERESTDVQPVVDNNKVRFIVTIHEEGYITSVDEERLKVSKPEALTLLEQEKEKAITQEVRGAVNKAQSLQSDFLGLGDRLYRKYPDVWDKVKNDWNTTWLPQVEVDVSVQCELRHTGNLADPLSYSNHQ